MKIEKNKVGDALIIRLLDSRLDAHCADDFRQEMSGFVSDGNRWIILNMSKVEFVDSSGLGAIVALFKSMEQEDSLIICGTTEAVTRMFKLTRMNKVFRMFEKEEEAVGALAGITG